MGFSDADREKNLRRDAELAKLKVDAGLIVLVIFISPFRAECKMARKLFEPDEFLGIFVDTPLEKSEWCDICQGPLRHFEELQGHRQPLRST